MQTKTYRTTIARLSEWSKRPMDASTHAATCGLAFAAALAATGCQDLPRDDGQIWSCYGIVMETLAGSVQADSNLYFGGCSPSDPGLQIVTYARPQATQDEIVKACDASCNQAFSQYWQAHPEVQLPLSCQTLFAAPCSDPQLGADTSKLASGVNADYFCGGPADTRTQLQGTVSFDIDGAQASVPAEGIVDSTYGPCEGAGQTCIIDVSRLDAVAIEAFPMAGATVDQAQVQMQGRSHGRQSGPEFLISAGAVAVEGNFFLNGQRASVHATNNQQVKSIGQQRGLFDFDITFGQSPRTIRVNMSGTSGGSAPTASVDPSSGSFECACKNCTTVTLTSTTTDPDNDVQNLSWVMDGQVLDTFGDTLPLQLPVGTHAVKLVATDTRGAASAASASINVVDTTPPVITVPADVSILSCAYPNIGQATAVDACSQAFVYNDDPGDFRPGVTTVQWTAEDEAGNVSQAIQRVTVTQVRDVTCCPPGYNIIMGTNGSDNLVGTDGPDCIIGLDGDDIIDGRGGDDYIIAGNGQDRVTGGDGNDVILGGDGDDVIDGGDGDDWISGGSGQDHITGGAGNDHIRGGDGDDEVHAGDGNDEVIGGDGQDTLWGEAGDDILSGGRGDDHLLGGDGNDRLVGGATQDHLEGGSGNDILIANDGDDWLEGGPGDDLLAGGPGHNRCYSGGGTDRYLLCEVQQ